MVFIESFSSALPEAPLAFLTAENAVVRDYSIRLEKKGGDYKGI